MSGNAGRPWMVERPWIDCDLAISRDALSDVEAHALAEYPSECCGFLSGPASDPARLETALRAANEADKYHALDPERFPRTSRTYFKINELRAARVFEEGEAAKQPIKVIYHSHCDAGAYFSEEDAATFAVDGSLMWPCAFLVVSVMDARVWDRRLWAHVPGTNGFREARLTVCSPEAP